jgi:ATP-dependent DNA helicase RecG
VPWLLVRSVARSRQRVTETVGWVQGKQLTNASPRERFGIDKRNSAMAFRLIADAVDAKRFVPMVPNEAPKDMRYIPWWAADPEGER